MGRIASPAATAFSSSTVTLISVVLAGFGIRTTWSFLPLCFVGGLRSFGRFGVAGIWHPNWHRARMDGREWITRRAEIEKTAKYRTIDEGKGARGRMKTHFKTGALNHSATLPCCFAPPAATIYDRRRAPVGTYQRIRDRQDDDFLPEATGEGTRSCEIIFSHPSHINTSTPGRPLWAGKDSKKLSAFPQNGQASKVLSDMGSKLR